MRSAFSSRFGVVWRTGAAFVALLFVVFSVLTGAHSATAATPGQLPAQSTSRSANVTSALVPSVSLEVRPPAPNTDGFPTLLATVKAPGGSPATDALGYVWFFLDGSATPVGKSPVLWTGTAWYTPFTKLANGAHTYTAKYVSAGASDPFGGVDPYADSAVSAPLVVTVASQLYPSVTLSTTTEQSVDGLPTVTADVTVNGSAPTVPLPGKLEFFLDEGSTPSSSASVTNGSASFTPATPLSNGSHTVTAQYVSTGLSDPYRSSTVSSPLTIIVNIPAPTLVPSVSLAALAPTPNTDGFPTLRATVKAPDGSPATDAWGDVEFFLGDSTTPVGKTPVLWDGTATYTPFTKLANGAYAYTAKYVSAGSIDPYADSVVSAPLVVTVASQLYPSVTLSTETEQSADGLPTVTADVTVNGAAPTVPLPGKVEFFLDEASTPSGSVSVTNGSASFTPSTPLSNGSHTVTAQYVSTGLTDPYMSSTPSSPLTIDVNIPAPTTPTVSVASNLATSKDGFPVITATVKDANGRPVTSAAGNVVFFQSVAGGDPVQVGSPVTVRSDGTAAYVPTAALADGSYSFTAQYRAAAGDPVYTDSAVSAPVTVVVSRAVPVSPTPTPTTQTPTPVAKTTPTAISAAKTPASHRAAAVHGVAGRLPKTGATGLFALSAAAALILIGAAGVLVARRMARKRG